MPAASLSTSQTNLPDDGLTICAGYFVGSTGPSSTFAKMSESTRRRYATVVLGTAARISEQLGYRRSYLPPRRTA